MLKRSWLQALCAAVCVVVLTGCGEECVDQYDCRNKQGPPPEGKEYQCVRNQCELVDEVPGEVTCSPECAGSEFCDTSSGQGVCRTCNATQGCTEPQFCNEAANGGKGVCVACADTGSGTDQGCSAAAPVCDASGSSGVGVCKACVDSTPGSAMDSGCSASRPVCDITGGNGAGVCKGCMDTAQGDAMDLGCTAANPVCEPTASNGAGACRTCLDSAQGMSTDLGCSAAAPICNATASGGRGSCRTCLDSAQGSGMDLGCGESAPLCDAVAGATGTCKACMDTGVGNATDQGCSEAAPLCDTEAGNGGGMCRACVDSAQGVATDQGCSDAAPLCDSTAGNGAGACRVCMVAMPAAGTDVGCSTPTPICDAAAGNGAGMCKVCRDTAAQGSATADRGCSAPTSLCDATASNGMGSCKVCLTSSNEGCPGAQTCNVEGTACEGCVDNASCANPSTPVCKPPPPVSICVECTENVHCSATRPACDMTTNFCGCETDSECDMQVGNTDFCDLMANNGRGECKVCVTDEDCEEKYQSKPYCDNQTACIQCRTNADCALTEVCNASKACETVPGPTPAQTSAQINMINTGTVGPLMPPVTVENAFVTYIKPAVGNDVAGFFLQAQAEGPAMFVVSDLNTLMVGDRVTLTVNEVVELSGKLKAAANISNLTVVSSGHPVQNMANDPVAPGLAVDRSATTDLATAVDNYVLELIRLSGTIAGNVEGSGNGHSAFVITTDGVKSGTALKLRVPTALANQYELGPNCTFTLDVGPMWRFISNANPPVVTAQPSAYSAADFSVLSCPAPRVIAVSAPTNTAVKVTFDRNIDPASVTNAATQFTFTPGDLMATGAIVDGKEIILTTNAQTGGVTYSLSVANSVKDFAGKGVVTPNSASFTTFLAVRNAQMVITGTGFAGTTEVTIGGVAQPFRVFSDTQLNLTVTETAPLGSQPIVVTSPGGPVTIGNTRVINLVINEIDADTPAPGVDVAEFVEISTGVPNLVLSGFVLVFFNGNVANEPSYLALDISATADANGLIVAGNAAVTPRAMTFADNTLQNGADAVAIYQGSSAAFPTNTPASSSFLIDAIVYDTNDPDDVGLLDVLLYPVGDARRVQVDEAANNDPANQSIQRCGTALRDGRVFNRIATPTPSAPNACP
jgi:hypothetical protein